uniref:Glucosidase 2 subunit beta n=1 Tax=Hemiselmis tepida TaxID=464990 RepID=A0A7S0YLF9_9CRYP
MGREARARIRPALCIGVIALAQTLGAPIPPPAVRGVAPANLSLYNGSGVQCGDGTLVPFSHVNDDYCDCEDNGADEPGSSACSGISSPVFFYCENRGDYSASVPVSRFRDGVCDCCDGSDEEEGRCVHNCQELGEERVRLLKRALVPLENGLKRREEYVAAVRARAGGGGLKGGKWVVVEAVVALMLPCVLHRQSAEHLDATRQLVSRLERQIKQGHQNVRELEARLKAARLEETRKALGADGAERLAGEVADDAGEGPTEGPESDISESVDTNAASEGGHVPSGRDTDGGGGGEGGEDGYDDDDDDDLGGVPKAERVGIDQFRRARFFGGVFDEMADFLWRWLIEWWFDSFFRTEAQRLSNSIAKEEATLRLLREQRREKRRVLDLDFGPDGAYQRLSGKCFEGHFSGYRYNVCPFSKVEQQLTTNGAGRMSVTRVGGYKGWKEPTALPVMEFDGGAPCPGHGGRKAELTMVCGEAERVLSVAEDSTCFYKAEMATPAACTEALIRERRDEIHAKEGVLRVKRWEL